jgi:mRNA interferase YafO
VSRVFLSEPLRQLSEEERVRLVADFKAHIEGEPVPSFGRDERYDHLHTPPLVKSEEVAHIHLEDSGRPWPPGRDPYRNTSDAHLIYCRGAINEDCYLLMAILEPDAHEQAKQFGLMVKLGEMAENFRQQF